MKEFFRYYLDTTIKFKLGKNAEDNHNLIDISDKEFWWFHLKNYPSGHCVCEKIDIDNDDIIFAANIVKSNSKYKNRKNVSIIYTQIKNIKKTNIIGEIEILGLTQKIII